MHPLARKLHRYEALLGDDVRALEDALYDENSFAARVDIVRDGDRPDLALVVLSGWAFRYKVLKDGSRQILAFLMPGDFCHLNLLTSAPMDHGIATLTPVTVARIDRPQIEAIINEHPRLAKAMLASQFADEARLRASIVSLRRKGAAARVGHCLCELWMRADAICLVKNNCLDFPPTQTDLADSVGLTAVHLNRVVQRLRKDDLVKLVGRSLKLPDFDRLARTAGFGGCATGVERTYFAPLERRANGTKESVNDSGDAHAS